MGFDYSPTTWVDGTTVANAATLGNMETGIDRAWNGLLGYAGAVVVASNDAPQAVKDAAHYVCDGTADQVEINAALALAAAISHGAGTVENPTAATPAGSTQRGWVCLTGGRFNISDSIVMWSGERLTGVGYLTEIRSTSNNGTGMIKLGSVQEHLCEVGHLWLNGNGSGTSHGIDFDMSSSGNTSNYPDVNGDSYHFIHDLLIKGFTNGTRHGVYLHAAGTANNRGNIVQGLQIRDCSGNGIYFSSSSDNFIGTCHVGGSKDSGIRIATGNTKIVNCKTFYSGIDDSTTSGYGFYMTSGRGLLSGCESQDDNTGFFFDGNPYVGVGLVADSALNAAIRIGTNTQVLNGFNIFNRGGSIRYPTSTIGLYFDATYTDLSVIGSVGASNITTPISGAAGSRSFMRVSNGTSLVSVG